MLFLFIVILSGFYGIYELAHTAFHLFRDASLFELPNTKWLLIRSVVFVSISVTSLIFLFKRWRKKDAS